jgi:hypothetical protein
VKLLLKNLQAWWHGYSKCYRCSQRRYHASWCKQTLHILDARCHFDGRGIVCCVCHNASH